MRIQGITSAETILPAAQKLGQFSGIHWIAVQVQRVLTVRGNSVYQAIVIWIINNRNLSSNIQLCYN